MLAPDIDLFTDEALAEPYALYDEIRDAGPAVWMPGLDVYAMARYAETRAAARNFEVFSSGRGVMLNEPMNTAAGGVAVICSDPPRHEQMRRIIRRPLMADAVRELTPTLVAEAQAAVDHVLELGTFDAIPELAHRLPLAVISKLVGIQEKGRERMLEWAAATFDAMGPLNARTAAAVPVADEMRLFGMTKAVPPHLAPGGWAQAVFDAGERGEVDPRLCPAMMSAYLAPSLDTTINGLSNAFLLLGEHPDQWDLLRADPSLIPGAVNEVLRLESPIQRFTRYVTEDHQIGDVTLPEGSRVMLLFGAANRDERRWTDATRFDVRRERTAEHLAFGFGPHACVGSALARLEMRVMIEALVARVERFEIGEPKRQINQFLRGLSSLQMTIQ